MERKRQVEFAENGKTVDGLTLPIGQDGDIGGMALLRSEWGRKEYWGDRIARYLAGGLHPQKALAPRVAFVAMDGEAVVGFIAGHLTRRYECDGELEWINVSASYRRMGVASELLRQLARWFTEQGARRICVNVAPDNVAATEFYVRNGAERLNEYFRVWSNIEVLPTG